MPSDSVLGQDIVVPGVDVLYTECPPDVIERSWAIAFLFQHGKFDEFGALVEHGREAMEEFSTTIATVFECRVDDLVLVRADSNATEWLCRFATTNPDEFVYEVTIGPLLGPDEPFAAGTYISFRIRHDDVDGKVIGRAFDVTFELT